MLYNVAFFGIMTDLRYDRDKAKRYLNDLYAEMNAMYKNNIAFMKRQSNLKPFVYNQPFKSMFNKVADRYKTNISMANVNTALNMADEIKDIARDSLKEYQKNMEETNKLLVTSEEMNLLAKDYQKNAQTLEDEVKKSGFWMCSKQCLMWFGGGCGIIFIIYMIISLIFCDKFLCL